MKIVSVVGARPNFMKIAPFIRAIEAYNENAEEPIEHLLVHTGQHYDDRMSKVFFETLDIPEADIHLGVGSGTHAEQVGQTMIAFEKVVREVRPDWVVVVGDVNATLACAVTAKKEGVKLCHIEAGLRSGDMSMPEEINRLVTDRLSDLLLTPDRFADENLQREGVDKTRIVFVGNIMIDTLEAHREQAAALDTKAVVTENVLDTHQAEAYDPSAPFSVVTLHRPSNVDEKAVLEEIVDFLSDEVANEEQLLWPVHPRTRGKLESFGLWGKLAAHPRIALLHPLHYHAMLHLNMHAHMIFTDSGGLQEESCVLGTPCLTFRWNTERPVTLARYGGASILVGNSVEKIREAYASIKDAPRKPTRPERWDGKTAERCVRAIVDYKG